MSPTTYSVNKRIKLDALNQQLDAIWHELATDPDIRSEAESMGVDVAFIADLRRDEVITVQREGAGIDPLTTAIIVSFTPVAAHLTERVILDLWTNLLLRRLRSKLGDDAITQHAKGK